MITHHTQLLQALIDKYGLKSYLEIGIQNPVNNFDKINCESKFGVDPVAVKEWLPRNIVPFTSDIYFSMINKTPYLYNQFYNLIFLDGDHTVEQVKKDFENSLRCLSDNGFICLHDALPENEEGTLIPRQTKKWWGTVYKFIPQLWLYPGIKFKTFDIDQGCCMIWKEDRGFEPKNAIYNGQKWEDVIIDWNFYQTNKHLWNIQKEVII